LASGSGSNLQALIDLSKTTESYFSISTVISNNPGSYALVRAARVGIADYLVDHRAFATKGDFEARISACLQEGEVELVVLAGFLRVLSPHFLKLFEDRIINLHPSLLPKHKGLHAIEKALTARDRETGCTVHLVDAGLDTGPMIAQRTCPIIPGDDLDALTERIQKLEHQLLPSVVNKIAELVVKRDFV
jgi:formyltetrahydrofolate-dependent phosphoribosylglycinamide formyltransferase